MWYVMIYLLVWMTSGFYLYQILEKPTKDKLSSLQKMKRPQTEDLKKKGLPNTG